MLIYDSRLYRGGEEQPNPLNFNINQSMIKYQSSFSITSYSLFCLKYCL
jgi:hypothetical protein